MPVSVNKLTVNTEVNKQGEGSGGGAENGQAKGGGGKMSKVEREDLIQECMDRVREYLEYEFRP